MKQSLMDLSNEVREFRFELSINHENYMAFWNMEYKIDSLVERCILLMKEDK